MSLEDLGKLTYLRTYAKNGEVWEDTIQRYLDFFTARQPDLADTIETFGQYIKDKKCAPSMRALQNAGLPLATDNARGFNCGYVGIEQFKDLADLCVLLCCGAGLGVGVCDMYIKKLPVVNAELPEETFTIPDSKEGWGDSILQVLENPNTVFDYSKIRGKGEPLVTSGGTASGPDPLKESLDKIAEIVKSRHGKQLTQANVADVACLVARAVVAGGTRRSALLVLFDDPAMREFKQGNWFNDAIWRSQANISELTVRDDEEFEVMLQMVIDSEWGEPAIALCAAKDPDENIGLNPCAEVSLRNRQFCNLSSVILPNCVDADDFTQACSAASFFGTLQATLTDFKYIDSRWKLNTEADGLIGVSLTGIAQMPKKITMDDIRLGALVAVEMNKLMARALGINPAKRVTTIKPEGTLSCVMGTTSGIHWAYGRRVIRRVRVNKHTPFGKKLVKEFGVSEGYDFIVPDNYSDNDIVLQFPCEYRANGYRSQKKAIDLLKQMKLFYRNWVKPGHVGGQETHNVSITVEIRPDEKEEVKQWMIQNKNSYRGIATLPYDGGNYELAPMEEVSADEFNKYLEKYPKIDFSKLQVKAKKVQHTVACSGGSCEVNFL